LSFRLLIRCRGREKDSGNRGTLKAGARRTQRKPQNLEREVREKGEINALRAPLRGIPSPLTLALDTSPVSFRAWTRDPEVAIPNFWIPAYPLRE